MPSCWTAYNELAWTEDLLGDLAECANEAAGFLELIRQHAVAPPESLLHLGCGAGAHDVTFKQHCSVTGVDISRGMLDRARGRNPEVTYIEDDLRTVRLGKVFDAVAIPDSIDYMVTREDLRMALDTAAAHLKPGGVLLVVCKPRENFRENNFGYTGTQGDVEVTLFENNYINPNRPETYEATLVYLVRRRGELTVHTDYHVLGLFTREVWDQALADAGFHMQATSLDGAYDPYLLGDGAYPQLVFVGAKR